MGIDIRQLAELAQLTIEDDRVAALEAELNAAITMVGNLPPVPAGDALFPQEGAIPLRDDVARSSCPREQLLSNAPETLDGFIKLP